LNYEFVVSNEKAAAQIFQLLPQALSTAGNFPQDKTVMRKLIPLNTKQSMGYVTTLALLTYPNEHIDALRVDIKTPNSPLYTMFPSDGLVSNFTAQINPAIDIVPGSYADGSGNPAGVDGSSPSSAAGSGDSDMFGNSNGDGSDSGSKSPGQPATTAGIALGVVGVAAAYGAAMFVIARRYKRKKQAHRRASSITNVSDMRMPVGSPALMGGALLSRDFSSYGGVAGGRHSHGSGQTGQTGQSAMGNSARTAYISAPVAAENSLGWN
jgi:hypothetical protein